LLDYEYKKFPEHKGQELENHHKRSSSTELDSSPIVERKQKDDPKAKKNKRKTFNDKDIIKDNNGQPIMPLSLGELTIENLGTIIPRPPFMTEKHIWPVGFISTRYFSSMINPDIRVKYTSSIIESGDRPQFIVTAEDDLYHPIISPTPSGAWRTILKRVIGSGMQEDTRKSVSVSGALRFGLAHPVVSNLIRQLPNAASDYSPIHSRKRKNESTDESSNDEIEELALKVQKMDAPRDMKITYQELFSARHVELQTRDEMDDLESAVATLHSLRFLSAYC